MSKKKFFLCRSLPPFFFSYTLLLQGGYDYDFIEELEHRLECSICLLALRDPYQTSCGHRFCYSCIITWINEGRTCPHDNSSLGEGEDRLWCMYYYIQLTNSLLWYSTYLTSICYCDCNLYIIAIDAMDFQIK